MIKKLTEKQIESQILSWLNLQPQCFAFKVNTVGIYDPIRKIYRKNRNPHVHLGCADIIGSFRGHFFAFEVKRPKQKQSPEQILFEIRVNKSVGRYAVIHSLEEAQEFMSHFKLV